MKSSELPKPECKSGYTNNQLEQMLGARYKEFMKWMYGQTMTLCDGKEYDHELKEYKNTNCGPHGAVVYPWDLKGFLDGRQAWD
jgi:hypothetical protein